MGLIFKIHHETQDWCDLPSENGIWDMSGDSMASFIQHFFGGLEKYIWNTRHICSILQMKTSMKVNSENGYGKSTIKLDSFDTGNLCGSGGMALANNLLDSDLTKLCLKEFTLPWGKLRQMWKINGVPRKIIYTQWVLHIYSQEESAGTTCIPAADQARKCRCQDFSIYIYNILYYIYNIYIYIL